MYRIPLSIPEIAIIGGTRAALGAGVALLLAERLNDDQRRALGWALVGVGAISTVPIAIQLLSEHRDVPKGSDTISRRMSQREYAS